MSKKLLINDIVMFIPEDHKLLALRSHGQEVSLNIPASRCLLLLLQRPGEIISRREFLNIVWESQGQYVTENTFHQNISILRRALNSVGLSRNVIRTIPKEGIRFSGTVVFLSEKKSDSNYIIQNTSTLSNEINGADSEVTPSLNAIDELSAERKTGWRIPKVLYSRFMMNTIIIVFSLAIFGFFCQKLYNSITRSWGDFANYRQIGEFNHCLVFVKKSEVRKNDGEYMSLIKEEKISCGPGQIAYITKNENNKSISVNICNRNSTNISSCVSHDFFERAE